MKHGKFECDFKWKNNAQQFRLKNKNVMPHECKFAFPHFNMGPTPEAVAIPGHTHNGTDGQHYYFEKEKKKLFHKILNNLAETFSP